MNTKIRASLALVAAATLCATALAAPNRGTGSFARADVNKDRALTKQEACAGKTQRICKNFEAMDSNRDGVVTRAEVKAFRNAKRVAKGLPARP
jgi:hypothetical protein